MAMGEMMYPRINREASRKIILTSMPDQIECRRIGRPFVDAKKLKEENV